MMDFRSTIRANLRIYRDIVEDPDYVEVLNNTLNLAFFALDIVRMVWRMPLYHGVPWSRQALTARPLTFFGHFTS
jgi:hypothetical protein